MSRKIKINTVNTTDLENTLNENLTKKHVTISGPEETIVVSDDTHRSEEDLKANLEREKKTIKEIRKTIDDSKDAIQRYQKVKSEDTGDANASTNNTSETFCQNVLKRFPNIKEKTSSILSNVDNSPIIENEENRISVNNDIENKDIQASKKYVEEHIIPRKKELERIEEETRNIQNLSLSVTKPYEEVNHPDHYNVYDVEVVEMMERIFGIEETMSWCKLNAFKYRMRAGEKPTSTVEKDLKKEKWCLNKYKELKSKI